MATSHGRSSIVGQRIFRAEPWPRIAFTHSDPASAETDAATLRAYLEECRSGKRKDKPDAPTRRGWWED